MFIPGYKRPIINSLLDVDFYKFTMGQLVFHKHPDVVVRFELTNRTKNVLLAKEVDIEDLRRELDYVRTLRFTTSDLHYLRGTNEYGERMFKEDYLEFLAGLVLPEYSLEEKDGQILLAVEGKWAEVMLWETIMLCIITELRTRKKMAKLSKFQQDMVEVRAKQKLFEKIEKLIVAHARGVKITFSDFGTRRRASHAWQAYVIETLINELPKGMFLGTSNVEFANRFGIMPMGTNAHELPMAYSGIYHQMDDKIPTYSQKMVLSDWEEEYPGGGLTIALPDTFGSKWFFDNVFTPEQAIEWKGTRQDSGDPREFGDMVIKFYESLDIDPTKKLIVFSDGLDIDEVIALAEYFQVRIIVSFGIGTNLTNDIGFDTVSIVVKIVKAAGYWVIKLSDNIAKAMGAPEEVERRKELNGHNYDVKFKQQPTY